MKGVQKYSANDRKNIENMSVFFKKRKEVFSEQKVKVNNPHEMYSFCRYSSFPREGKVRYVPRTCKELPLSISVLWISLKTARGRRAKVTPNWNCAIENRE